LLSHSSGLPVSWAGIQDDPNEPPRSLDELLSGGLRTVRAPGAKLIYANDAFALAGWIAARAAGVDFDTLAQRGLFDPLGMTHSTLVPPRDAGPALAAAYGGITPWSGKQRVPHQTVSGTSPAGALITTAGDLARFGMAMLRGGELGGVRVLAPESVAEMMRLQARAHPRMSAGFGLGFGVSETAGRKLVWWDGGLAGAASRLALLPEHGVGIAMLSNLADNAPTAVASRRILDEIAPPPPLAALLGADDADEHVGVYALRDVVDPSVRYLEWFADLRVTRDGDALWLASPLSSDPSRLIPLGDDLYVISGPSMLDGATVLFADDHVYAGFVSGERISFWRSGRALLIYAAAVGLALVGLIVRALVRFVRRRRSGRLELPS